MFSVKNLGKDVVIYAMGTLAQRAVTFFLLPLYTNALSVSEYGLLETVIVTGQILLFVMDIGMSRSVLRYYARYRDDPKKLGELITTALALTTLSELIFMSIVLVARTPLSILLYGDEQFTPILVWILFASMMRTFNQWIFVLFRARRESGKYVLVSVINLLALTTLNILFVNYWHEGVLGVLYAQTIVYLAINIIFFPRILITIRQHFGLSWTLAKQLFRFGFPLIITMSGMLIINSFDRYFLIHHWGLEEVGIYSLGVRIAAILGMLIVTPFQLAWGPFLFEKENQVSGKFVSRAFTYLILALAVGGSSLLLFSREVILILASPKFFETLKIIPFTILSMALLGIYYWAGGLVNISEQTWKLGVIVFFAGLCNIGLNAIFTPLWGGTGAAWANVLAKVIATGLTMLVGIRYIYIPFERKRIFSIGLFVTGLWILYFTTLSSLNGPIAIGIKLSALVLGLFILFVPFGFVTSQEWNKLQGILATLRSRIV